MKLQVNNIIDVHGFVMLSKMEGTLKVSKIDEISYWFTRPKGKKTIVRHLISDVDRCIKTNSEDLNKITINNNEN
jgi:hypothetical protein